MGFVKAEYRAHMIIYWYHAWLPEELGTVAPLLGRKSARDS